MLRVGLVVGSLMLTALTCGEHDRAPQTGFVVTNETPWVLYIVVANPDEAIDDSLSIVRSYSPPIEPGSSFRRTYDHVPDGRPGGCFLVQQMYAVRGPEGFLDGHRITDQIRTRDLEVVFHWPPDTCFTEDDQEVVILHGGQ